MSTATATPRTGVEIVTNSTNLLGPILVATDGTSSASAALKAAALMSDGESARVMVLAVLEPLPLVAADYGLLLPPAETDDARRQALLTRVYDQIAETVGAQPSWEVQVRNGDPAAVIARTGREVEARLAVGPHLTKSLQPQPRAHWGSIPPLSLPRSARALSPGKSQAP